MPEENVVVAVFLPIREAGSAIGARLAREAGSIARPRLGELEAVLPADDSRLAGERAERLPRGIRAQGFGHGIAHFEMEHDSRLLERLRNRGYRVVPFSIRHRQ